MDIYCFPLWKVESHRWLYQQIGYLVGAGSFSWKGKRVCPGVSFFLFFPFSSFLSLPYLFPPLVHFLTLLPRFPYAALESLKLTMKSKLSQAYDGIPTPVPVLEFSSWPTVPGFLGLIIWHNPLPEGCAQHSITPLTAPPLSLTLYWVLGSNICILRRYPPWGNH